MRIDRSENFVAPDHDEKLINRVWKYLKQLFRKL